jgi:hypothetical protein
MSLRGTEQDLANKMLANIKSRIERDLKQTLPDTKSLQILCDGIASALVSHLQAVLEVRVVNGVVLQGDTLPIPPGTEIGSGTPK